MVDAHTKEQFHTAQLALHVVTDIWHWDKQWQLPGGGRPRRQPRVWLPLPNIPLQEIAAELDKEQGHEIRHRTT